MIKKNTSSTYYLLVGLIIFSFLLRLVTSYSIGDTKIDNEWSVLLNNLISYNSYAYYKFGDELIPSAYMPPAYPFLLYFVKAISFDKVDFVGFLIFIQIILSTYSVYIFYQLNHNFFSKKISLVNAFIFSIFPLNVYACGQVSSINLQIFFSLLFLLFLFFLIKKQSVKNIIIFSTVSGLLVLTRGEFILIFFIIIFYSFFFKKIRLINLIKVFLVVFLVVSPYVIRNYIHFNEIFIVKSLGYNLWKGNNQFSLVGGFDNLEKVEFNNLKSQINNLKKDKYYELKKDNIFFEEAKKNLSSDPFRYVNLFAKKFISYYFVDLNSNYPNYYNFFHFFPVIILALLSLPGLLIFLKKNTQADLIYIYLFSNLTIFSFFFILPRYKLGILPVQIILATYFVIYLIKKVSLFYKQ